MALQKSIDRFVYETNVSVPDVYIKVEKTAVSKTRMRATVVFLQNQTSEIDRKSYSIPYDINGENPIQQAYEHLKTLPEFSGATDV